VSHRHLAGSTGAFDEDRLELKGRTPLVQWVGDRGANPTIDEVEILLHDIAEGNREKYARVDISVTVNIEMGQPSHHAPSLGRTFRVGDIVDDRRVTVAFLRIDLMEEVLELNAVFNCQERSVIRMEIAAARPGFKKLNKSHAKVTDELSIAPKIP